MMSLLTVVTIHVCASGNCFYINQLVPGAHVEQQACYTQEFNLYKEKAPAGAVLDVSKSSCTLIFNGVGGKET